MFKFKSWVYSVLCVEEIYDFYEYSGQRGSIYLDKEGNIFLY